MSLDRLWLVPIAVGHLAIFFLVANVVHAFGHSERALAPVKLALAFGLMVVSAAIGWEAWNSPLVAWSRPALGYAGVCLVMGLVVFPASTAYMHFRPRPGGIAGRVSVRDLAASHGFDALAGEGRYAWLLKLPGNQALRLNKVEWELTLPGLPHALDGLSVLHLSDLHLAPSYDRRFFEAVADEAASWDSDLVLFTGDLVDEEEAVEWVVPILSRVKGKLGSFAILGNHDLQHQPDRLRRLVKDAGFTDLEAGWATVTTGGKTVALGGTSYPWGQPLSIAERPEADFRMLLSHCPDLFSWAERVGFDLMLAGHNHGGQVRLPLVGAVFMPSKYSRRFDRGFFRKNGLTLHVSQGVAGKHPVRYGCPPEVSRMVLRSAEADRRDSRHNSAFRVFGHGQAVPGETPR